MAIRPSIHLEMDYLRLIFALLAGASLLFAAASPERENGVCEMTEDDFKRTYRIIEHEDNGDGVTCYYQGRSMTFSILSSALLKTMIQMHKPRSFSAFLSHIDFETPSERATVLTSLLRAAFQSGNNEISDFLLSQRFKVNREEWRWVYCPSYEEFRGSLDELKQLISRHPEHANRMTPRAGIIRYAVSLTSALVVIELTRHCDTLSGKSKFDPTKFLCDALKNRRLVDSEMVQVAQRLFELGAYVSEEVSDSLNGRQSDYAHTIETIDSWKVDVKEPEMD